MRIIIIFIVWRFGQFRSAGDAAQPAILGGKLALKGAPDLGRTKKRQPDIAAQPQIAPPVQRQLDLIDRPVAGIGDMAIPGAAAIILAARIGVGLQNDQPALALAGPIGRGGLGLVEHHALDGAT